MGVQPVTVDGIMSNLQTISGEAEVPDAADLMLRKGVGSLVITVDRETIGIITETDIVELVASSEPTDTMQVSEIMSSPLITIESGSTLEEAAAKMKDNQIKKLPVEAGGNIVGMITTTDISHYFPKYHPKSESWIQ